MKYWDTSAIVPLCLNEPASTRVRELCDNDGSLVVWWGTRTEAVSAIARCRRDGVLDAQADRDARRILKALASAWSEVLPSEPLRLRSERLLTLHPLRAGDAFQLAAALVWSRGATTEHDFVCLDERLRMAAAREGFRVLPDDRK